MGSFDPAIVCCDMPKINVGVRRAFFDEIKSSGCTHPELIANTLCNFVFTGCKWE